MCRVHWSITSTIVLALAASIAAPAPASEYASDWFLVRLSDPLPDGETPGTLALESGRIHLDEAIRDAGILGIRYALKVTMREPRFPELLSRHGLDRTYRFHVPEGADIEALVDVFNAIPGVEFAEPDYIGHGGLVPDDPRFDEQWGLHQTSDADIDAPEAWSITTGGPVVVAILDSGVDSDHPDFAGKIVAGYDFVNDNDDPEDDHWHGTAVSSITMAATDNAEGMAGACWGCRIMPIKVINASNSGTYADWTDGAVWAVDHGADIINISAGGTAYSQVLLAGVAYAYDAGVIYVTISHNDAANSVRFPGRFRESITLGATNSSDERATFSNWGQRIDVVGPGVDILKAAMGGGYNLGDGTSFAAPFAAGLMGLMKTVNPAVGREEARHLIRSGAEDEVGDPLEDTPGFDQHHGWGRMNMERSLLAARSSMTLRVEEDTGTRVYLETPNPIADSYDFVRGDVAALREGPEDVDLGAVVCLEDDSPDADTAGNEDFALPAVGKAFFYLARFNAAPGAGSYGGSRRNRDRTPMAIRTGATWTAEGGQQGARFGSSVGSADVNGDGYADLIVGIRHYDGDLPDEGGARIFLGSLSGLDDTPSWEVEGDQAGSEFGWAVGGAGDVNGDGYEDVVVGAPTYDNGETNEGRVVVYHGSASGPSTTPDWSVEADQASAEFGFRVRSAGDVNGDGYGDVIVGARLYDAESGSPGNRADQGAAFLYLGSASGLSASPDWSFLTGQLNARGGAGVGAGDVNGDGYDDVIVGAPLYDGGQTNEGRVWIFHGSASGSSSSPDTTLEIDSGNSNFGYTATTAGDVNNDGFDDVIAGAHNYDGSQTDEGRAFVFLGSAGGVSTSWAWSFQSGEADAQLGISAEGVGDMNGDGYDDIAVGSNLADSETRTDAGHVAVFRGSASGPEAAPVWSEAPPYSGGDFGWRLVGGDVDGDGLFELIVGAVEYGGVPRIEGRVLAYHGPLDEVPAVDCNP
jgi:hypothetical protein